MIKKVKELLESGAITQEVADQLNGEWKIHTQRLNDENKQLRQEKEDLSKAYDQVFESKNAMEAELQGLDDRIEQAKKDGQTELQQKLEAERTAKQELQTNLEKFKQANQNLTIENSVSKALANFDMIDAEVVAGHFSKNVVIGDDGRVVYKNGDSILSLEDGAKSFFEVKPNLLKSVGEGGSGTGGGGSGSETKMNFGGDKQERRSAVADMIAKGQN